MVESIKKLCMNCMNELYSNDTCSVCGYDNKFLFLSNELSLAPGSMLADNRYVVGNVISFNGEGFSYIGYDFKDNIKVWIRELYPDTMVERGSDGKEVVSKSSYATQFKTLKVDFSDIHSILMGFKDTDGIVPVLNYFEQNNTVYCITKFIQSISLEEFLQQIGGSLDYNQASAIFEPMLKTLANIHMNNLVHRGINPKNLIIDVNGDLRLTNFCISSVRTLESELTPEIYPGYTAPEQYNVTSWQGTWTDVYSVAAVLYNMLTGVVPQESITRKQNDTLIPVGKVNSNIPSNVVFAIQKGLIVDPEKRVETIESFYSLLVNGSDEFQKKDMTKQVDFSKNMSNTEPMGGMRMRGKSNVPTILVSMFLTSVVLLFSVSFLIRMMSTGSIMQIDKQINLSEESDASENTDSEMTPNKIQKIPDFKNRYLDAVKLDKGVDEFFQLIYNEEKHDELIPKGMVISQDIDPGTVVPDGDIITVRLVISQGPQKLPELSGMTSEDAIKILDQLEIPYEKIEAFNNKQAKDIVISAQRGSGKVILIVSKGPQEIIESSSSSESSSLPGIPSQSSAPQTQGHDSSSGGNYWESIPFGQFY